MTDSRRLVDKLWSYCNVLRDDGVGVIEYTEQLTYLLFLKMAHERATRKLKPQQIVPDEYSWQRLLDAEGTELEVDYTEILVGLAQQPGTLGTIFRKAQNRIQDPAKLKRLIVDLIDQENWSAVGHRPQGRRLRGAALQGRLGQGSGAGQYFTPRDLIQAMVDVHPARRPTTPSSTRPAAPAASCSSRTSTPPATPRRLTPTERDHLRDDVRARLRAGRRHRPAGRDEPAAARHRHRRTATRLIDVRDALIADPGQRWSVVLSNPPFGRKSSLTMVGADGREAARGPRDRAPGLRRHHDQQAAQLPPAHHDDPRHQRPRGRRAPRQRALRGRRRRDAAPQAAGATSTCTRCCGCRPASSTPRA